MFAQVASACKYFYKQWSRGLWWKRLRACVHRRLLKRALRWRNSRWNLMRGRFLCRPLRMFRVRCLNSCWGNMLICKLLQRLFVWRSFQMWNLLHNVSVSMCAFVCWPMAIATNLPTYVESFLAAFPCFHLIPALATVVKPTNRLVVAKRQWTICWNLWNIARLLLLSLALPFWWSIIWCFTDLLNVLLLGDLGKGHEEAEDVWAARQSVQLQVARLWGTRQCRHCTSRCLWHEDPQSLVCSNDLWQAHSLEALRSFSLDGHEKIGVPLFCLGVAHQVCDVHSQSLPTIGLTQSHLTSHRALWILICMLNFQVAVRRKSESLMGLGTENFHGPGSAQLRLHIGDHILFHHCHKTIDQLVGWFRFRAPYYASKSGTLIVCSGFALCSWQLLCNTIWAMHAPTSVLSRPMLMYGSPRKAVSTMPWLLVSVQCLRSSQLPSRPGESHLSVQEYMPLKMQISQRHSTLECAVHHDTTEELQEAQHASQTRPPSQAQQLTWLMKKGWLRKEKQNFKQSMWMQRKVVATLSWRMWPGNELSLRCPSAVWTLEMHSIAPIDFSRMPWKIMATEWCMRSPIHCCTFNNEWSCCRFPWMID